MYQQAVIKQTLYFLQLASDAFGENFDLPEIRFDLSGKAAGYFKCFSNGHCLINYNPGLLLKNKDDFIGRTVPHEVAHMVAYLLHGKKIRPHGDEWKAVMKVFVADPSRCHDYDVSGIKTRQYRRYLYQCSCRSHQLTSIRHNRVMSGLRYICKQCNQQLSFQRPT